MLSNIRMRVVLRILRGVFIKSAPRRNPEEVRRKSARSERAILFGVRTARLVRGNHTVVRAGPNNTYFVWSDTRGSGEDRKKKVNQKKKDRQCRWVRVVVNRSENEGDWPDPGVRAIGSCIYEKCACNECRERQIFEKQQQNRTTQYYKTGVGLGSNAESWHRRSAEYPG